MKVVTCGFSLYRRNRELHALSIIGLNCQDKKKKRFTRFHLYDKLQTDKLWAENNQSSSQHERLAGTLPSFLPNNLFSVYLFTMSLKLDSPFFSCFFCLASFLFLFVTSLFALVGVNESALLWKVLPIFPRPFRGFFLLLSFIAAGKLVFATPGSL